jgi:hypothetical protein
MSHLLSLGAINKYTGKYVYPKKANKKDEYICPECNTDLILCQGKIRVHHFRHKVDNINPCHHYSNPTETEIHKDAKILMKTLLENKTPIQFIRKCISCYNNELFEIPEISETSIVKLEYRFEYNGVKIADVAYIDNNELLCIFEICNTHKTCSENRPEPWFEINAETLIKLANDNSFTLLEIPCKRCEKCESCVENENITILNKKTATKKLIEWIKDMDMEPFYFRDYDGTIDLINNWSDFGSDKDWSNHYNVGNVKPDIVMYDKCNERYYIYLNKPSFTPIQIQEYSDSGIGIYFVDVDWILKQEHTPIKLKYILIFDKHFHYKPDKKVEKNTRLNIRGLDRENFVYLNVDFSQKNIIKNIGGKWNKDQKLWYISCDKYEKYKNQLDMYKIFWKCKDCEGIQDGECWDCFKKDLGLNYFDD